jgi:phenylacetate-CoA ligase
VNLFPMQVEEIVLRSAGLSPHFTLELSTRGRMDLLAVRAEARPGFPAERWAEAAAGLAEAIRDALGLAVEADVVAPRTLPRSEGKLQRVRDLRSSA